MPILIKDFSWSQSEEMVNIKIFIKGVTSANCDVFTAGNYVKVHCGVQICEIFLNAPVDADRSSCVVTQDEVQISLHKMTLGVWSRLEAEGLTKEERASVREVALNAAHQNAKCRRENLQELQTKLEQESVREQMKFNESERLKLEETRKNVIASAFQSIASSHFEDRKSTEVLPANVRKFPPAKPTVKRQEEIQFPAPRCTGEIDVEFTPRTFPTPKRESMLPEEKEWLTKQVEARKVAGFSAPDLRPEENDPIWIKEKADGFLQLGNYLGAEAAYSHAITTLGCRLPALYCNRAAAHLALGNLHKAVEDCSTGLELLTPATRSNQRSRARCHARRGAALCKLGCPHLGLPDLKAALALCPEDQNLRNDIEAAEKLLQQNKNKNEESSEDSTDSSDTSLSDFEDK